MKKKRINKNLVQNIFNPNYIDYGVEDVHFEGAEAAVFFDYARYALIYIINSFIEKNNKIPCVALPRFICVDVVEALRKTNCKIFYYDIDSSFQPINIEKNIKIDLIIAVNYFGKAPNIKKLKSALDAAAEIILDCAQGYLGPYDVTAHYVIFSFRKTIPVHKGAALVCNQSGDLCEIIFKKVSKVDNVLNLNISKKSFRYILSFGTVKLLKYFLAFKRRFQKESFQQLDSRFEVYSSCILPKINKSKFYEFKKSLYFDVLRLVESMSLEIKIVKLLESEVPTAAFLQIKNPNQLNTLSKVLKSNNLEIVKWPDFDDYDSVNKNCFYNQMYFVPFVW